MSDIARLMGTLARRIEYTRVQRVLYTLGRESIEDAIVEYVRRHNLYVPIAGQWKWGWLFDDSYRPIELHLTQENEEVEEASDE